MSELSSLSLAVQIALVAVPVAVYFGVLGVLNSRPNPQLLTSRQDLALLLGALAPLLLSPAAQLLGQVGWLWVLGLAAVAIAAAMLFSTPCKWVIYNISAPRARQMVIDVLEQAGFSVDVQGDLLDLGQGRSVLLSEFALLRNVSVQAKGLDRPGTSRLRDALAARLEAVATPTHPMASAMLLVAAFMLCAPLALVARQAPQLVRLITGLF